MSETRQINGDAAVSGNVAIGGNAMVRGNMTIEHGLKVKGWLEVENMNFPAVGVFKTAQELTNSVTPQKGYIAGVIEDSSILRGYRIRLWTANGTSWTATNPARYLDVSVVINMTTDIEGIDAEEFVAWQHDVEDALSVKVNLEDLVISESDGVAMIQLRPGLSVNVLTGHQDISGKANKSELMITGQNGIFNIQLKTGTSISVYTDEAVRQLLGRTVGDVVKATFSVPSHGHYDLIGKLDQEDKNLRLVVVDGIGYTSAEGIELSAGKVTVQYFFADASIVPDGAFDSINGDIQLMQVYLPSSIQEIGKDAFKDCTTLDKVICKALTPPIGNSAFTGVDVSNVALEVEKIVKSDYSQDIFWGNFMQ